MSRDSRVPDFFFFLSDEMQVFRQVRQTQVRALLSPRNEENPLHKLMSWFYESSRPDPLFLPVRHKFTLKTTEFFQFFRIDFLTLGPVIHRYMKNRMHLLTALAMVLLGICFCSCSKEKWPEVISQNEYELTIASEKIPGLICGNGEDLVADVYAVIQSGLNTIWSKF